jgi:hypothetical protein
MHFKSEKDIPYIFEQKASIMKFITEFCEIKLREALKSV